MRNVSNKSCRENQITHFIFNNVFRKSYRLCDNVEKYCRTWQATDDNIAFAHCMLHTCGYSTHPKYLILIAFLLKQWLHERASLLCCTYIPSLVVNFGWHASTCISSLLFISVWITVEGNFILLTIYNLTYFEIPEFIFLSIVFL